MAATETDVLTIGGKTLHSRLLLGTGGFRSLDALAAALAGEELPAWASPADPLRFAGVPA